MKEFYIDDSKFKLGLYSLEDTTKAPYGSAREMKNMQITSRGGVAPRMGTQLLGASNSSTSGGRGFYNFRKSFDEQEYLIKAYDDELEVYSKNHTGAGWFRLKNGYTVNSEFGFATSLVNTDSEDYTVFGNRYQDFSRWRGTVTQLNGALVGAETAVVVDSVLTEEIFDSHTASASSATTLDIASADWAASQWVNFYVYITSGVHSGKIRLISASTTTQITFATLGSDPVTPTFEIRKSMFPASGTIIYNGTTIAYTAIPTATTLTVASAHAAPDNSGVALVPDVYPGNPRGNRFTNYLGRIIVGKVRSALARGSGGALQGFASGGSVFVSKLLNPYDFSFAATRASGEGDIIAMPYGGEEITDVAYQEDTAYAFKPRYIEAIKYSQDSNDLAVREPLKSGIGSAGQVVKGSNDIYFFTDDKRISSIGRVSAKDSTPQTENMGYVIKRLLETYLPGQGKGIQDGERIYFPLKSDSTLTNNDIVLVYNTQNKAYEGIWDIAAYAFEQFNKKLYYLESNGPNVFEMNVGHADVSGDDRFSIVSRYSTHFMNFATSKGTPQALHSLYFEGYIKGGTTITFKSWKEFATDPWLEFTFTGTETAFLDGSDLSAALGENPLGLSPLGSIGEADEEGRRHFYFRIYFPFQYANFFSVGFESDGVDLNFEITRFGMAMKESFSAPASRIKSI